MVIPGSEGEFQGIKGWEKTLGYPGFHPQGFPNTELAAKEIQGR